MGASQAKSYGVNVTDFGADPTASTDSTQAFVNAIGAASGGNPNIGGVVYIPGGIYRISQTLRVYDFLTLRGPGTPYSTILDFQNQTSGPGLLISDYGHVGIEGMAILNTAGNGIEIRTEPPSPKVNRAFCHIRDIVVSAAKGSGFYVANAIMTTFERCWARDVEECGFRLDGFHTSMKFDTCWASGCKKTGFHLNRTVYTSLNNCGSDANGEYGYFLTNCECIVMNGCGAETNYYSSIGMAATDAWAQNCAPASGELRGITVNSFFSLKGNCQDRDCKDPEKDCDSIGDDVFGTYMTLCAEDGKMIEGSSHNHFSRGESGQAVTKRGYDPANCINFPIFQGGADPPPNGRGNCKHTNSVL
ncbi:MAG: glycosyl hydrolase family 28-related protein [Anaerolineae bacterium]